MKEKYKETQKFTKEVIAEILEVKDESGLTAETLLDRAKNKKSNLHDFFEWDNSEAGEKWRLQQARIIINDVKIIVEDKELFAFENVSVVVKSNINSDENTESKREYKTVIEISSNEDYRSQVLNRALGEISYWKEKYNELNELKDIFKSIEKTKTKWQKK